MYEDVIVLAGRHFDLHRGGAGVPQSPDKTKVPRCQDLLQSHAERTVKLGVTAIPYRCLIPQGSDDIIVAGRCIAADGQAMGPA